jgi:two-component system response regulator DctR
MTTNHKSVFRVVLIEDDPMVQEVNRQFVEKVEGFQVVGVAGNGNDGLRLIQELSPDLVFLDVFMPSLGGVETLHRLRSMALPVDVVVVSAAKDAETVRKMLRNGAFDYIIKPFKLERIRQTLERYRAQYETWTEDPSVTQDELDRLLMGDHSSDGADPNAGSSRETAKSISSEQEDLPKGLNAATLKQVLLVLRRHSGGLSAEEAADGVGIARVTARRYLDYLEKAGSVELQVNYGGIGRPVNRYVLARDQNDQK